MKSNVAQIHLNCCHKTYFPVTYHHSHFLATNWSLISPWLFEAHTLFSQLGCIGIDCYYTAVQVYMVLHRLFLLIWRNGYAEAFTGHSECNRHHFVFHKFIGCFSVLWSSNLYPQCYMEPMLYCILNVLLRSLCCCFVLNLHVIVICCCMLL